MVSFPGFGTNCFIRSIDANDTATLLARNRKNIKVMRAELPSTLLNTFRHLAKPDIFITSFSREWGKLHWGLILSNKVGN
jgi:hypothetical protein